MNLYKITLQILRLKIILEYQLKYVIKFRVNFILVMCSQLPLILIYLPSQRIKNAQINIDNQVI